MYILNIVGVLRSFVIMCKYIQSMYEQNLNAGLLPQHHFWAGLIVIFGVAVLLFIKPKLAYLKYLYLILGRNCSFIILENGTRFSINLFDIIMCFLSFYCMKSDY